MQKKSEPPERVVGIEFGGTDYKDYNLWTHSLTARGGVNIVPFQF